MTGHHLKHARQLAGLSQAEVTEYTGISLSTVRRMEKSDNPDPVRAAAFAALIAHHGVTICQGRRGVYFKQRVPSIKALRRDW